MQGTPPSKEEFERLRAFTLTPVLGASTVVITEAALPSSAIAIDARKLSSGNVVVDDST